MKTGFYQLLLLCLLWQISSIRLQAQTPDIAWAKQGTGNLPGTGRAVAHDKAGNTFVTGEFEGGITFNDEILIGRGQTDVFIAKYDASGTLVWGRKAGGAAPDLVHAIAVDSTGNAYITGRFSGTASFGTTSLTSSGNSNMYLAKYDPDGNLLWARQAGGSQNTAGRGLAVDEAGNAYVTGNFFGQATFGSTGLTSSGSDDIFVTKYSAEGNVAWARRAGGTNSEMAKSIALDKSGNAYIAAFFSSQTLTFGETMIPVPGNNGLLLAKYSASGTIEWASRAGGGSGTQNYEIAVDGTGGIFLTGSFTGTTDIGSDMFTSAGNFDVFLAKYREFGAPVWATRAGGTTADISNHLALDGEGNIWLTGSFVGTTAFGSFTLTSEAKSDIFAARFDDFGHVQWAERFGGKGADGGNGIFADKFGKITVTGHFGGAASFGTIPLTGGAPSIFVTRMDGTGHILWAQSPEVVGATAVGKGVVADEAGNSYVVGHFSGSSTFGSTTLTSEGTLDIFIASYDVAGNVRWVQQAGGLGLNYGNSIALDGTGNILVTGQFEDKLNFGTTTLTSAGQADIFVAKYDPSGTVLWAERAGGPGHDAGHALATDASGNIYVTGSFSGVGAFGTATITSKGLLDIFMAKYNTSGQMQWVQRVGGTGNDIGRGLALDEAGNVYVTGYFTGTVTIGKTILTSAGGTDVVIIQSDNSGYIQWLKQAGGQGNDAGAALAVDGLGNIYLTGEFTETAGFGTYSLTTSGSTDIFLAKMDGAGITQWAQRAGGTGKDYGVAVALDQAGLPYITGTFSGTADYGNLSATSHSNSLFLARYSAAGDAEWLHQTGEEANSTGYGVALNKAGNIFVTGYFYGTAQVGPATLNAFSEELLLIKVAPTSTPTAIASIPEKESLQLYPVPVKDILHLHLPLSGKSTVELRLLDPGGRMLLQKNFPVTQGSFEQTLDLRDRIGGIYLLQLITGQEVITRRIVKE